MTNLEAIEFAAKVQIGTRIKSGTMVMVVTGTDKYGFTGYSEYNYQKYGKKSKMGLSYTTLTNPHYSKSLKIIENNLQESL